MTSPPTDDEPADGRPLRLDPDAVSAEPGVPAFIARPDGAPVYHGFTVLDDVEVEGFQLGMITDFLAKRDTLGDAFVVAPDGTRCGLIWESDVSPGYFQASKPLGPRDENRWGVWNVGLPLPLTSIEEARAYLTALLPDLRREWEAWRAEAQGSEQETDE